MIGEKWGLGAGAAGEPSTTPDPTLSDPPESGHPCDATSLYEPNDTNDKACQIELGEEISTQVSADDTVDNFVLRAVAGATYTLTLSTLNCANGNYWINSTAKSLAMGTQVTHVDKALNFGQKAQYEFSPNTTADELITFTESQPCQYSFDVVESTAQGLKHDVHYEPNDTASTAAPLGEYPVVSSEVSTPKDAGDYFTFPVRANVTYTMHLSTLNCSDSNKWIDLHGWELGSGTAVANWPEPALNFQRVLDKEFTPKTSGQELFQILIDQPGWSCAYEFYVVPSTICGLQQADHEPNNTPSTAEPIALDEPVSSDVTPTGDPNDYYSFPVDPKTKYAVNVSTENCKNTGYYLTVKLWSGATEELMDDAQYPHFEGKNQYVFTSGNASQELLLIHGDQGCSYEVTVSKY